MYIAFGVRLPASTADARTFYDLGAIGFNTVVILQRATGAIMGAYRKQFPCCVDPQGRVGNDG